ncbi:MAG: hypothetical protein HWE20_14535 [Gammaproteobacteria bacterium]|nr:hypothetical protein [Gammaproteobacteria bacterium]
MAVCLSALFRWLSATVYWLATTALLPWFLLRLWRKSRKEPRYFERPWQRLGLIPRRIDRPIWLHGVSVGEVVMLKAITDKITDPIAISTTTAGGLETAERQWPSQAVNWWPFDHPLAALLYVWRLRPRMLLIAETELWPAVLWACRCFSVPVYVVNGRISDHSFPGYQKWSRLLQPWVQSIEQVFARTAEDAARFDVLGVGRRPAVALGNLKYDREFIADHTQLQNVAAWGGEYLLLASTHPSEEMALLGQLLPKFAQTIVIAPRHVSRAAELLAEIAARYPALTVARGSARDVLPVCDILIADQFGEMLAWFAKASCVIMGGSFIPHGGQNPVEAAAMGSPVLIGPHGFNFKDDIRVLTDAGALDVVTFDQVAHQVQTRWGQRVNISDQLARGAVDRLMNQIFNEMEI